MSREPEEKEEKTTLSFLLQQEDDKIITLNRRLGQKTVIAMPDGRRCVVWIKDLSGRYKDNKHEIRFELQFMAPVEIGIYREEFITGEAR